MKIAINAKILSRPIEGGIAAYTLNIYQHLLKQISGHELYLISDMPVPETLLTSPLVKNCVVPSSLGISRLNSFVFSRFGFSRAFKKMGCDVAFIPWVAPFAVSPAVVTVHDLVPLCSITKAVDQFHHQLSAAINFQLFAKVFAKHAGILIADSEDTKRAIQEFCRVPEKRIRVIPLGVNFDHFYPRSQIEVEKIKAKYRIKGDYFMNVASLWQPRKNLENLLEAFALFSTVHPKTNLVITGKKGPSYSNMLEIINKHKLQENVFLLEFVPYQDLPYLLSGALGLVFPSFHEGFGLPVLEAMSCGCPVISSDKGALPEVGGHAVEYINPFEIDSIASSMRVLMENEEFGMVLRARGLAHSKKFSWENTAFLTLKAIEEVV